MNEYATEIRIRFYDDNFNVKELFQDLQNLKAKDYLKLYQLMYNDLIEKQSIIIDKLDEGAKCEY